MYIGYQNGLYEENPMIFSSLTLILKECSKLVPRDAMLNFLNHCSLITSDCDPKTKFILFENIHNDLITYYPQLYESNVVIPQNILELTGPAILPYGQDSLFAPKY